MEGHLEEEHFEKGKGLFEKGHLEKRQLRKGIVEGQFRKGIMEGQSGGALWKGRKGTVHKLEFIQKNHFLKLPLQGGVKVLCRHSHDKFKDKF